MTTYLTSKCHCGLNTFRIPLDSSKLPHHVDTCHCNACRHVTGQLNLQCAPATGVPLSVSAPEGVDTPADLGTLVVYRTSDIGLRYFCGGCGAHMIIFIREPGKDDQWLIMSGTLDKVEGITYATDHIFVEDTLDGGLADHFRTDNGKEVKRYEGWIGSKEIPIGWKSDKIKDKPDVEKLPFFCHCKAIQLHLTRVKEKNEDKDYWLGLGEKEGDPIKYMAVHCLCTSCRLTTGNLLSSWIESIPLENVIDSSTGNSVIPSSSGTLKGLKAYESSPGIFREFCETCGATVFYWKEKQKDRICVTPGLVDEEVQGARAEKWLKWHEGIFHGQDAMLSYAEKDLAEGTKKTNAGE